jgi:7-cyano-7-deazaguanine synthase
MGDEFMSEQLFNKLSGGSTNTVHIFWTGGWDSTYRMVELSQKNITIQPLYCVDKKRNSYEIELARMKKITEALRLHEKTKAQINDIKVIDIDEIPENQEITDAYKRISSDVKIGIQYEWLSRLALQYSMIELGVEKPFGDYSGCNAAIEKEGALMKKDDTWVIDKKVSSEDLNVLFGNISFPIIKLTEKVMAENIVSWGYEDVMKLIWFCHSPIHGEICGICRPCQQKMECGMDWLLPIKAKKRYKFRKNLSKICGERIADNMSRIIFC